MLNDIGMCPNCGSEEFFQKPKAWLIKTFIPMPGKLHSEILKIDYEKNPDSPVKCCKCKRVLDVEASEKAGEMILKKRVRHAGKHSKVA